MRELLSDIGCTVIAASLLGLFSYWLRQPLILAYLIAGAVIGPKIGLGVVASSDSIEVISELGLILLLYIIGLEINLKDLLSSGKDLLISGIGQFPICVALGFGIFPLLASLWPSAQLSTLELTYLVLMCSLSSTAIVVKLLYDKREFDTLPGRLTLGILVLQDLYAIFVLALQPSLKNPTLAPVLHALQCSAALIILGFLISKYVLRHVFQAVAMTPEIVVSLSLGWCACGAATAELLGLSREMGALVAGMSISAFPYSIHVAAKTLPLRDFFLTLFFVSLGMKIEAPTAELLWPVLSVTCFVVFSRFTSLYPLLLLSGSGKRAAFVTSLNLAQLSEFSLVIATLGVELGHLSQFTLAVMIYSMAILAIVSSYAIRFNHQLYVIFERLTGPAELRHKGGEHSDNDGAGVIVLLGCHRIGLAFLDALENRRPELLRHVTVIDFNPKLVTELRKKNIHAVFGDIANLDTLSHAHLDHAQLILSTIPDMLLKGTSNSALIRMAKTLAPEAVIAATADDTQHEAKLFLQGAHFALKPFDVSGGLLEEYVSNLLDNAVVGNIGAGWQEHGVVAPQGPFCSLADRASNGS